MVDISIVIPVYNSEDCLLKLNEEISKSFSSSELTYQLILVNDRSKDQSWKKITEICTSNKHVTGVSLRKNSGQDNALLAGLRIASGEYTVIMDDDLQHAPSDIFTLYNKIKQGYDVCYAQFPQKKQALWKNFGSWLNGKLSEKLLAKPKDLYLSPFKIIRGDVVKEIVKFSGGYPYIDATILGITGNLTQEPVDHHHRFSGSGNYSLFSSISVFIKHATSYSIYPLRLASYTGFGSAFIGFLLGIYYLIDFFIRGSIIEGWVTLALLILFFGGVILMSLGVIGEYIGRMYLTINSKPQYTIEKIVNSQQEHHDTI